MAETPAAGDERRPVPTLAWVIGAVLLTAAIFAGVLIHVTHAARVVEEPLANPAAAATAPAAATTTQAAPTAQATAAGSTVPTAAAVPTAPTATAPTTKARTADGERMLRHGRPAAALALFQQTLARNPDDTRAQRGACVALGRLGRAKERARLCGHRSRG